MIVGAAKSPETAYKIKGVITPDKIIQIRAETFKKRVSTSSEKLEV